KRYSPPSVAVIDEAPKLVHDVLHSPGQPLDPASRAFFEPRFGYDFSRIRVHADREAARSARAIGALAYTVTNHIVLAEGSNSPPSSGDVVFAHELAHVVQQGGASTKGGSFACTAAREAGASRRPDSGRSTSQVSNPQIFRQTDSATGYDIGLNMPAFPCERA